MMIILKLNIIIIIIIIIMMLNKYGLLIISVINTYSHNPE